MRRAFLAALALIGALAVSGRAATLDHLMVPDRNLTDPGQLLDRGPSAPADGPTPYELRRSPVPTSQPGAVDPAQYVLGPGDLLQLDLWGRVAREIGLEVSPEGKIFLPGSGPIVVSGHTLAWARENTLRVVAATFRGVSADLRLVRLRTFKVYVSGRVAEAGAYEATAMTRASEVLDRARLLDDASRRRIEVRRIDGTVTRADLQLFELAGRQDADPLLRDGDVLQVGTASEWVSASGAVARPGRFELVPGDSLTTLLRLAGGPLASAVTDHAALTRFRSPIERESLTVDLPALLEGRTDLALRGGDALFLFYVPSYHLLPTVTIVGEVLRPGTFPITLGHDRLSDLVGWAGGFGPRANRSGVLLFREPVGVRDTVPDLDRLTRLSRDQMTESEYSTLETSLAERKNRFRIDWDWVENGRRHGDLDPLLRDGDVVRVDPLVTSVRVSGQVGHPGVVEFVPGRRVSDYVRLSGGFTSHAASGATRVTRAVTGQIVPAKSVKEIEPGDFIWVPERRDVDPWTLFRDVLAVAGQVAVIVVATRR